MQKAMFTDEESDDSVERRVETGPRCDQQQRMLMLHVMICHPAATTAQ